MNLYFIVEGKRTETQVYPAWLSQLLPQYSRVSHPADAEKNHYYLAHGSGVPSLHRFVSNAILELNDLRKFGFLVICLDADEFSVNEVQSEVRRNMESRKARPQGFEVKIIVQNRCIETWMLGNTKVFQRNPASELLRGYIHHYDVSVRDPELMPPIHTGSNHATFHHDYLKLMLAERNILYTKEFPRGVTEPSYLSQLMLRTQETQHLQSLKEFFDFCKNIAP